MLAHKLLLAIVASAVLASAAQAATPPVMIVGDGEVTSFSADPLFDPALIVRGAALERISWHADLPRYVGDAPGSLSVLYRADLAAGRLGWRLGRSFDQDDRFVAAAIFELDPEHFEADPNGYFQISWGLWNEQTTGLERTGSLFDPSADTFELLEFDYFPNRSPFFGGPWVSPTLFGVADESSPLFERFGAFANMSFASTLYELPLGVPLIALIEHAPDKGTVTFYLAELNDQGGLAVLGDATTVVPLAALGQSEYSFDTVGLTLWHDGWGGEHPAVDALVHFHRFIVSEGGFAFSGGSLPGGFEVLGER